MRPGEETPVECVFRCVDEIFVLDFSSIGSFFRFIHTMCELREALPLARAEYKGNELDLNRFLPDPGACGNAN
jgi:hypothetical protein